MYEDQLTKLKGYDVGALLREGQDINFSEYRKQISVITEFLINVYESEAVRQGFSDPEISQINDIYTRAVAVFDEIASTVDWAAMQPNQIQNIKDRIQNEFSNITSSTYFARVQAAKALELQKSDTTAAKRKEAQDLLNYIKRQVVAVDKNVEKSNEALAQTIETSYGKIFEDRAENYKKTAKWWLVALVVILTIYSLGAGWLIYKLLNTNVGDINGVSAIFKLAALLGGLYLISILNKNYSANKHLEVVNRHRGSIFAVINNLVDAQKDDANKQYLLAYGAKVIFDIGESGYISRNYGAGSDDDGILTPLLDKLSKVK